MSRDAAVAYQWMDVTRALAAFAVVLAHARDLTMPDYSGETGWAAFYFITGFGHQAVIVFFVISGYWIGRDVLSRSDADVFWRPYLAARMSRLWVVLLPALALGGVLDFLGAWVWRFPIYFADASHSLPVFDAASLSFPTLLGNILFLQEILVRSLGTNGPLWSLACEFWFYLWFPALVRAARGRPSAALASLAILWLAPLMLFYFAVWLIGVGCFVAQRAAARRQAVATLPRFAIPATMFAAATGLCFSRLSPGATSYMVLAATFAAALYCLVQGGGIRLPRSGALAAFGRCGSFSLYAIHFPVLVFAAGWLGIDRSRADLAGAIATIGLSMFCLLIAVAFAKAVESNTAAIRAHVAKAWVRSFE